MQCSGAVRSGADSNAIKRDRSHAPGYDERRGPVWFTGRRHCQTTAGGAAWRDPFQAIIGPLKYIRGPAGGPEGRRRPLTAGSRVRRVFWPAGPTVQASWWAPPQGEASSRPSTTAHHTGTGAGEARRQRR